MIKGILAALVVLLVLEFLLFLCGVKFDEFWDGLAVEIGGGIIDVALVTVIIWTWEKRSERRARLIEAQRRINKLKRLDKGDTFPDLAEAVESIRADAPRQSVDLGGARLTGLNWADMGVGHLGPANFAALRGSPTILRNVAFDGTDCTDAVFSVRREAAGQAFDAFDLSFHGTKLVNARFDGARLIWSTIDEDRDGGPFKGADLKGASFAGARLERVDLRGALNLSADAFAGAELILPLITDNALRTAIKAKAKEFKEGLLGM